MCDDCPATHLKEHLLVGDDAILFQQCAGICDPVALNHLLARGLVLGFERFRRRRKLSAQFLRKVHRFPRVPPSMLLLTNPLLHDAAKLARTQLSQSYGAFLGACSLRLVQLGSVGRLQRRKNRCLVGAQSHDLRVRILPRSLLQQLQTLR